MVDILDRVRNKALQSKIVTPEEAADFIKPGMTLATSGFTSSAYPKAVPLALADRMKKDPFTVNIMTGASTGPEFDEALASVHGIKKTPAVPDGQGAAQPDQRRHGRLHRHSSVGGRAALALWLPRQP